MISWGNILIKDISGIPGNPYVETFHYYYYYYFASYPLSMHSTFQKDLPAT